ncbi:MADS-BOX TRANSCRIPTION FACTOR FAMILY PROTEIN [Salix viminalis]|uniref:MADS-BOX TRANSCRIPTION FACTOR FAMILY PROTEIN n=1 Tax=Salix viminalis TaxID=40686 RepID=A0A9Q0SI02_SALVM|nr:MADS-BOX TRANSCRIPTION FACTOR FAMILY PROTEIN [Salix viminalis]
MGRNKLPLKKIDNPCRRKITYSKRRDGIIKKATELSVLCDTDVGVLMYSPHGRLTTFSSNGSIEDIFLRYFDQSNEQGGTVEKEGVRSLSLSLSLSLSVLSYGPASVCVYV